MAPPPVAPPKLAVESRGDILHLVRTLKTAALARVEASGAQGKDKEKAVKAVEKWVDDVFELAGPNVLVNGIEYAEAMKDREEYEPKDDRLDKLILEKQAQVETLLMDVAEMRRNYPAWVGKLTEDAEKRRTWNEAEGLVFVEEQKEGGDGKVEVDVEGIVREVGETAEAVKEMSVTLPALESKLTNAHSVMSSLGLLDSTNPRESIGGLVRAEDEEPSTPRRAVPALVKKLRGSGVGVEEGMDVDVDEE